MVLPPHMVPSLLCRPAVFLLSPPSAFLPPAPLSGLLLTATHLPNATRSITRSQSHLPIPMPVFEQDAAHQCAATATTSDLYAVTADADAETKS
ncbi:hypothetical protein C8J57DRAFT_1527293 [Mycena rebaudengoi]|nr:hypothetical protein C8J57DRAFT_1527293 [Mycena rebaudengoi]